jgi:hypothetical protein
MYPKKNDTMVSQGLIIVFKDDPPSSESWGIDNILQMSELLDRSHGTIFGVQSEGIIILARKLSAIVKRGVKMRYPIKKKSIAYCALYSPRTANVPPITKGSA